MVTVETGIIVVGSQATVTFAVGVGLEKLALGKSISRHDRAV